MTIIEYKINTRNKCVSCKFYEVKGDYWPSGNCISKETKIKNRYRYYNSKACLSYRYDPNPKWKKK